MSSLKEFKIIECTHSLSTVKSGIDYAIVASTFFVAEHDAYRGVCMTLHDMYVIATDISDANEQLNDWITKTIGRK